VIGSSLFDKSDSRTKSLEAPCSQYVTLPIDEVKSGERVVGLSTYSGYSVNAGHWSCLAMIDEADAREGAEVTLIRGHAQGDTPKPM
jgi:glycine cleavage system aminomethyltransferase T